MRRALAAALLAFGLTCAAAAEPVETASLTFGPVLSDADAERYRSIFRLQETAQWGPADRLIGQLESDLLLGHVMAQRYLHPCCYRSKFAELSGWLDRYADHPQAERIYRLALRRQPGGAAAPRPPQGGDGSSGGGHRPAVSPPDPGPAAGKDGRYLNNLFWSHLRRGRLDKAAAILARGDADRLLGTARRDVMAGRLAYRYFIDGQDEAALGLASGAALRSGNYAPIAWWSAGLAAWRLGRPEDAARHFEGYARSQYVSAWEQAAGAYWAARAHLAAGNPAEVNRWLEAAAAETRTFYGILARRALGLAVVYDWSRPGVAAAALEPLLGHPRGLRAAALTQIGEIRWAERELWPLFDPSDRELADAMLALADDAGLPRLSLEIGDRLARIGLTSDRALFPVPVWAPQEGFAVDRALIYAISRQESRFSTEATSHAGARGLMQLMPRTASFVAGDRSLRGNGRNKLYDPALNLSLGQQYILHLLDQPEVDGNLFLALASYNGGIGNVIKWQRRVDYQADPLLFIETIPLRETRTYVERVLANLWIYRSRLGQPAPSLDALAAGEWPRYIPVDTGSASVARHEQD